MIQDILKKLGKDNATNRNILEQAINDSLKEQNGEIKTHLLSLELGQYLEEDQKKDFVQKTRPETYLKIYALVRDLIQRKELDGALDAIDATLAYIQKLPPPPPPANVSGECTRKQFNSFSEMLIYCTKNPSENCMWVAKDENAFLKLKGYILIEQKKYDKAKDVLELTLKNNPLEVSSYLELFEMCKGKNDIDQGKKYLDLAYENAWYIEDYGRLLRGYGFYYLEKQEYEKAQAYYLTSLMYDSSVDADKYVSNELNIIKEKLGNKFEVKPPAQTARFMSENKLNYLLPQETEVIMMKVLRKLYELKINADKNDPLKSEFMARTIVNYESNFKRVTLNKKELIEIVKTDVYTNSFMYINSLLRYSFKIDKAFKQMPPQNFAKTPETKNILSFLYKTNEKNVVEGFPITILIDKVWEGSSLPNEEQNQKAIDEYLERIKQGGYTINKTTVVTLPLGIKATKIYITKGSENRCTYMFNISQRAFGLVSCQVEHEGDINDSYLTEIVESWDYITYNKTRIAEVLDKAYSGYHSLLLNGGLGKEKMLKFATEIEFMLARIVPIQNKDDAMAEITGRKLVVGYILKELKSGKTRDNIVFDDLLKMLDDEKMLNDYFDTNDEVIGYYTRPAITSDVQTKNTYMLKAKEFILELEK